MKKITINGTEYILYAGGENKAVSIYPHMVEATSGKVPLGKQMSLLKAYLKANGLTPADTANTHWCIVAAMKIGNESTVVPAQKKKEAPARRTAGSIPVPAPSAEQVEYYLQRWDSLERYSLHENALDKLFFKLAPKNTDISDILLKASTLNDFYSTNIFLIYPVAKHIHSLDIDDRLKAGDVTLVSEIQHATINGREHNFYSFATKYCSHHNPLDYPIYDSYVDQVLRFFRDKDGFSEFANADLKNYVRFKGVLIDFRLFYGLGKYNLKEIDKYIWQLGKEYFPRNYGK